MRRPCYTPPSVTGGGTTAYLYNLDHQPTLVTRPDSQTIAFGYHASGQLHTVTTPTNTLTYGYNAGRVSSIANTNGALSYTYAGELLTGTTWSGTIAGSVQRGLRQQFLAHVLAREQREPSHV